MLAGKRRRCVSFEAHAPARVGNHAAFSFEFCLMNASRSALMVSAWVVGIPCGKPGYTLRVAPFTNFADCMAAAPMGTI